MSSPVWLVPSTGVSQCPAALVGLVGIRQRVTRPPLLEADAISGPEDVICRIVERDTEHLQRLVNQLLGNPAIRRCTSYIVLSRHVPPRTGPLVGAAGAWTEDARAAAVSDGGSRRQPR
jgi:Lrp/AsnC ligand binding domain